MKIKTQYKKRYVLLLTGIVIFSILALYFAIIPSYETWKNVRSLQGKISALESAPMEIANIEKRIQKLQLEIGITDGKDSETQKVLLEMVSNYCRANDILIREFPQVHIAGVQGYSIETHRIMVEGGFIPLLTLLNKLEKDFSLSRVVSVGFQSQMDLKQKRTRLVMSIYLQTIKNQPNEI